MPEKRGRKPKPIDEFTIAEIERLAGCGFTLDKIAIALRVSSSTVDRWLHREDVRTAYERGRIAATSDVATSLYDQAMKGDVAACIFWLKAQAGWSDKPQEVATQQAVEVHIYLPDNGR